MEQQITIKTPGKLMVAGEFAILEPYYQLIAMAIDKFVTCTIKSHYKNELSLNDYSLYGLEWDFTGNELNIDHTDKRTSFVKDAMTVTLTYLREQSVPTSPFSLSITSELDDKESGEKYGLGSSAAVVTSVITAILTKFLKQTPSRKLIFKLAAISHIRTQGSGSGADIAASTYGGVILYTSFQADWLNEELKTTRTLTGIIEKNWTYLSIKQIVLPNDVNVCIGWTGSPASTSSLVEQISHLKKNNLAHYEAFLQRSKKAVQLILDGMQHHNLANFYKGITENRQALKTLGEHASVAIETTKLHKLSMKAKEFGGAGKLSGAGGGDCGIAFIPNDVPCKDLHKAWRKIGIRPLQLNIYPHGTSREANV